MSADLGKAAVVGEAVSGVAAEIARARAAGDGVQLPMFEVPTRHSGRRGEELQRALEYRRERGRPPGAVNKSTKAFREWLLARGKHPLQWLMEYAMHTPTSLSAELGCTRLEAYDRLAAIAVALAPYFASKMVPVDDQGRPLPLMLMQFGQFGGAPERGGRAPWLYLESEQNQALAAPIDDASHNGVSHGEQKA